MTPLPRVVLAGVQSGVGKTTVTLAVLGALARRARKVQPFKAGPDFIDAGHHTAAVAGSRISRNLDPWICGEAAVRELFLRAAAGADFSVIEGVMGLFDGVSGGDDAGSAAHLARALDAAVVLVVDAKGMARSAAALVHGYATFDPRVRVAGVIFNRVSGAGHYDYLRDAVASVKGVRALGWLRTDASAAIPERHLGLVSAPEGAAREAYARLAALAEEGIDLEGLEAVARSAPPLAEEKPAVFASRAPIQARIAVARDEAFHFVYEDNLDILRHLGAEIAFFSPLRERALPEGAGLVWIGGGYPELFAGALAENRALLGALRSFHGKVYAECGGLMYCLEALVDAQGKEIPMAGLLPGRSRMMPKRQGLGYLEVEAAEDCLLAPKGARFRAHEFHYSRMDPAPAGEGVGTALSLRKPWKKGKESRADGWCRGGVMAGYAHVHLAAAPGMAVRVLSEAARVSHESRPS